MVAIADGCHLWSERYDRELTDIFAIQDEISQAIVDVLKVKLGPQAEQPLIPRRRVNMHAYQAYLEGRHHYQQLTEAGLIRSSECFERAIVLDPEYAAPDAGLAESYIYLHLYTCTPTHQVIPKALAAAERAVWLDPNAPEGYVARGLIRGASERNWVGANQDFEKALRLNPDSALAHYRRGIWYLMPMGRMEETARETERAMELDPLFDTGAVRLLSRFASGGSK